MTRAAIAWAVVTLVLVVLARTTVEAEHEVYYRYTVLGYAFDTKGGPLPRRLVELVRDRTGFAYRAETDEDGSYIVIARLSDESLGESLTLRIGGVQTALRVRFLPADHASERGTRVDLWGMRWVETAAWFRPTLDRLLGAPVR